MRRNRSNIPVLVDCIAMNGIKNIITSHWLVLQVALPLWYFQSDLTSGDKPGILLLDLGFQCLQVFLLKIRVFWDLTAQQ